MRMILVALAALSIAHANAFAKAKLFISIDVEEERSPDWVCVVTKTFVCPGTTTPTTNASECATTPVADFERLVDTGTGTVAEKGTNGAAANLRRAHDDNLIDTCDDVNREACRPTQKYGDLSNGHIVCGGKKRRDPSRVLILGLTYNTPRTPGVESVDLNGGNAVSLTLQTELPSSAVTFVHVLGGDFAPSIIPFVGDRESAVVRPNPRCSRFLATMPAHEDPIRDVSLSSSTVGRQVCVAREPLTTALPIELPYTPPNERKTLGIVYASNPETRSEATWNSSLPPNTIELGVRAIRFDWDLPGCLSDVWPDDDPPPPPPTPPHTQTWNAHCPQATLGTDTLCDVTYVAPTRTSPIERCSYTCKVEFTRDPLKLPLPVRFDRLRMAEEKKPPETVYSWNDVLVFSGQHFRSSVAPADRKVTLEFENRNDWTDLAGDKLDAVRVINRGTSDQLELSDRNGAKPPKWTALATPHRECTDQVRIAVFGTRVYNERARDVERGRLVLSDPYSYRSVVRPYLLLGAGLSYEDVPYLARPTIELGAGLQFDLKKFYEYAWGLNRVRMGFLSFNVDAKAQLTNIIYRGIETPPDREGFADREQLESVTHVRVDFRAELEIAIWRRGGFGLAYGVGFATPLDYTHNAKVGRAQFSQTIEVNSSVVLLPRKLWLIPHVGVRLGEQHFDYTTNFLGDPAPFIRDVTQVFWGIRLRIRIG